MDHLCNWSEFVTKKGFQKALKLWSIYIIKMTRLIDREREK